MRFVAIIGAGELGAGIACALASRGRVAEVRLIDDASDIATGKALDIQQAGPIERSPTRVIASSDLTAAVGAAAILLADRASRAPRSGLPATGSGQRAPYPKPEVRSPEPVSRESVAMDEYSGDSALALLKRLAGIDRDAVIVCAGGAQRALLERGLQELRLPRTRFFGSAAEAVVSRLRALVAVEADLSPSMVALSVLGRIPDRIVVPWRDATIAGRPLARVLDAAQIARIERRAASLGSPGPYTLAAAAARVGEMLVTGSRRVVCCQIGLEGEFGMRRTVSSLPVVIGPGGVARVVAPALDVREQVLLENALATGSGLQTPGVGEGLFE